MLLLVIALLIVADVTVMQTTLILVPLHFGDNARLIDKARILQLATVDDDRRIVAVAFPAAATAASSTVT